MSIFRRSKAEPRQPQDGAVRFDPEAYGCPLVGLAKSCAAMRRDFCCPHFRQFRTVDANGSVTGLEWKCAHFASLDLLSEIAGRLVGVRAAIETRADDTNHRLAAMGEQVLIAGQQQRRAADALDRIAATGPVQIGAPADQRRLGKPS